MANISNLERQHSEIKELFLLIKDNIATDDIKDNIDSLVKNINTLAGKLSVHMNSEDKFLYPTLIESKDQSLRELAKEYSGEMGNIHGSFSIYKNNFNTKYKILNNINSFLEESKKIISTLENRILKEDMHLYPKIKGL